jgi:hypothetical protein
MPQIYLQAKVLLLEIYIYGIRTQSRVHWLYGSCKEPNSYWRKLL